jgi:hypothetical protein
MRRPTMRSANTLLAASAVAMTLLVSCAPDYGPTQSYVQGVNPDDRVALVTPIEALVRQSIKTNAGAIAIATPWNDGLISPQLRADLKSQGYLIAAPNQTAAHRLGYMILPLDTHFLLRVFLDNEDGAQLYQRDAAGHLQPTGPLAVRGGAA